MAVLTLFFGVVWIPLALLLAPFWSGTGEWFADRTHRALALYARRARNVELQLDVATPDVSCAPIADDTGYRASALPGQTVLRLGKLIGERRASIEKDGSVVWSYTDSYARVVKPLLPPSLERFVRGHYTHW